PSLDPDLLPEANIVLYTVKSIAIALTPEAGIEGRRLIERLQADQSPAGRPILFVQALGVFSSESEMLALAGAGPKVCVASWIAENLVRAGLPAAEVVHVANGIDHRTFRLTNPIAARSPLLAMNYNPHSLKNIDAGIDALEVVHRELGVPSVLFGSLVPPRPLEAGVRFVTSPTQTQLAATVYRDASIYLQPSTQEGFGLCAIEAMACGCALVTTDNGGSDDYAIDGETAVVCDSDAAAMADALRGLLADDARRIRIASNGERYVERFRWATSARRLREVADEYLAEPEAFCTGRGAADPSVRVLRP
ncbi:MAG: glycosyltransferase family 4 protein, partial [Acidimicrobiales bacterium]